MNRLQAFLITRRLGSDDPDVRDSAFLELERSGSPAAVDLLIRTLRSHDNPAARDHAARSLARLKPQAALEPLISAFLTLPMSAITIGRALDEIDPDWRTRPELAPHLNRLMLEVQRMLPQQIGPLGPIVTLLGILRHPGSAPALVELLWKGHDVRATLQSLGAAAVPALAERFRRSPDPPGGPANRVYFMALQLLAELPGDPDAVEALIMVLERAENPEARSAAVKTLHAHGWRPENHAREVLSLCFGEERRAAERLDFEHLPALLHLVRTGRHPGPHFEVAARALQRLREPNALTTVVRHLCSRRCPEEVRPYLQGVVAAYEEEAIPVLIQSLQGLEESWRAAEMLGRMGAPQAVPHLERALRSHDTALRNAAAAALERLGGREAAAVA